ncbi:unnamed protein product [uncultured bacterium]|nr:unnamed protein product [uncultured bacterium]
MLIRRTVRGDSLWIEDFHDSTRIRRTILLRAKHAGFSTAHLARLCKLSISHTKRLLARATADRDQHTDDEPWMFLLGPNQAQCGHTGAIMRGDRLWCLDCDKTGLDHTTSYDGLPRLTPEPKLPEIPKPPLTRKERRQLTRPQERSKCR